MRPDLAQFAEDCRSLVPDGTPILDVHTHLGADEDGRSLELRRLLRQLDEAGIGRACVFPLHDPDRRPAYRVPNDRVLAWAGESGGRLVPFCRLDPGDDPVAELERCLARGARGVKLHPRAQSLRFGDGAADGIFRVAEEAGVPILIHGGRGLPPIAHGLAELAFRYPGAPLILAHGAIADQAVFASLLADHPAVFYDTSVFGPVDLLELYARVPPERIVFGSDPPYGRPLIGLYMTLRCAAAAGLPEAGVRDLLGGTVSAILEGRPTPAPTVPLRDRTVRLSGTLLRLYVYGSMAFAALVRSDPAAGRESLELARAACREPDPGAEGPVLERAALALDEVAKALDDSSSRVPHDLLYLSMVMAITEPS